MARKWENELSKWPCLVPDFKIVPSSTALVIIDMQRPFLDPSIGLPALLKAKFAEAAEYYLNRSTKTVIPNIKKLQGYFRQQGLRIIHITVGPELPDGSDFSPLRRMSDNATSQEMKTKVLYPKGTPEHAIIKELQSQFGELVVNKITRSAFNSTGLEFTLRNLKIDSLVICGVLINACVESTARDASDKGFKCIMVNDACLGFDQISHDATLKSFAALFGKVWDTEEVIKYLSEEIKRSMTGQ